MAHLQIASNPFALLMNPEAVVAAVERSARLGDLKRRICRPLDKPMIPHAATDEDLGSGLDDEAGFEGEAAGSPSL